MNGPPLRARAGATLLELLVALTLLGVVVGGAMSFLRQQSNSVALGNDEMKALQNARFALSLLQTDLRTAGSGVASGQPPLVYADSDVVVFNVNYLDKEAYSATATVSAPLYVEEDAPEGAVSSLSPLAKLAIPGTSLSYPQVQYMEGGAASLAETLVFFFARDSSTARPDDYVLFRQVNRTSPEVVARDLIRTVEGDRLLPFFEFLYPDTVGGSVELLAFANSVRLYHEIAQHHTMPDTGAAALIDRIRAVRVNLTGTNGQTGTRERTRRMRRLIHLPNAAGRAVQSCGREPLLTGALGLARVELDGAPAIRLTWPASVDEATGEQDVVRYVIWRRVPPATEWGDPYVSLPATGAAQQWDDRSVETGKTYFYRIAAQDCTPAFSASISASLEVTT